MKQRNKLRGQRYSRRYNSKVDTIDVFSSTKAQARHHKGRNGKHTLFVYLAFHFGVQLTEPKRLLFGLTDSFHYGFSIQQIPRGLSLSFFLSLWFYFYTSTENTVLHFSIVKMGFHFSTKFYSIELNL